MKQTRKNKKDISAFITMRDKTGQGHVEMILAFVIFIGFVGTLFFFLDPTDDKTISYTLLDITEEKLLENWSTSYNTISLILDDGALTQMAGSGKSCFIVSNQPELDGNLIVRDESGVMKSADLTISNVLIDYTSGDKYYKLHVSDAFSNGVPTGDCETLALGSYNFGSINKQEIVVYENIQSIINLAKNPESYDQLKEDLGIQNDFEIRVYEIDVNGNPKMLMNATRFVPRVVEVVARDIPLIVINNNAVKRDIIVNIRAW